MLCLCASLGLARAEPLLVIYPQSESPNDARNLYPLKVLELALTKAGGEFVLQQSPLPMQRRRSQKELALGQSIHVVWLITSIEREQELLPIRIPIDKGLLGWRIGLIRAAEAERFASLQTLNDVRRLVAGQQHDWADVSILRHNGLPLETGSNYDSLFQMLQLQRFDYFPRSVLEIWDELDKHPGMGLAVERYFVLQYPSAYYFFVNKTNRVLAERLERGLRLAIRDGSFDRLFHQYNDDFIKRSKLPQRKRIALQNPLLPASTPLEQKELWFTP
jgi:hypothetical protein